MKRGTGAIRMGAAFTLLFASLSMVVFRQGRALDALRSMEAARTERVMLQAERSDLQREIQRLESRARVVAVAGSRLGLRVPAASEIVILHAPSPHAVAVEPRPLRRGLLSAVERR